MQIYKETAIGGFLPDVKVNKVILNASSAEIYQRNPHIDHPSEAATSSNDTNDNLVVSLNMHIRDHGGYESLGTWFNNIEIEKYLRIRIIQIFNPENGLTGFQTATQAQATLNGLSRSEKYSAIANMLLNSLDMGIYGIKPESATQVVLHSIPVYSAQYDLSGDEVKLPYAVVDSGGRKYYDVSFEQTFILPTNDPQNLYYMVYTQVDAGALANDFGFTVKGLGGGLIDELGSIMGDVNFATVYTDGNLKKTSKFFLTPGGELYSGPIHYHNTQGYMAGAVHKPGGNDEEHFPLTVVKTENTKIHDNRQIDRYDDFIADLFYNFKKQLNIPKTITMNSQDFLDLDTTAYASNPLMTFDSHSNPRFTFSINMLQLAREMFLYGGLLRKEPAGGELNKMASKIIFQLTHIIGIELYRQRVDGGSTSEDHPEELIAELFAPELDAIGRVVHPGVSSLQHLINVRDETESVLNKFAMSTVIHNIIRRGQIPPSKNKFASAGRRSQATIRDISKDVQLNNTTKKIRTFAVTDLTAKNSPGAHYQYRIKMKIYDGSIKYLKGRISSALKHRKGLVDYLTEANFPGNFDGSKKQFTSQYRQRRQSAMIKVVNNATNSLQGLFQAVQAASADNSSFSTQEAASLLNQLRPHVIPQSGTPDGISVFLGIYDKILTKVIRMSGLKNIKLEGTAHDDKMFDSNGTFKEVVEISIPFKNNHRGEPAIVKMPKNDSSSLAFEFFADNFIGSGGGLDDAPLEGISYSVTHNNAAIHDINKINKLITINSNQFEDMRTREISKYFSNDSSESRVFNPGVSPGGPGTTSMITFNPYSPPQNFRTFITPHALRNYKPPTKQRGIRKKLYVSYGQISNSRLMLDILLLILIANKLDIDVSAASNMVRQSNSTTITKRNVKRYLLIRIATSMGIFSSQAVLNDVAGSLQDFSPLSEDENQELTPDAISQLGINEHTQDGDSSFGVDLDEDMNKLMQDILSYTIYERVLFPENAVKQKLKSYNAAAGFNQFHQKVLELDAKDDFSNGVLGAQVHFVHVLPPQIQYLFMRDTKTQEDGTFGQTSDSINDIYATNADNAFEGQSLDYHNISMFSLHNTNIYRLYYIEGYEVNTSSNLLDMKKPIVKGLGPSAVYSHNNAGKSLMCYMKRYEDPMFTINLEDLLDISVMNSCFMVDVPAQAGQVSNSPTSEEPIEETPQPQPFDGAALVEGNDHDIYIGGGAITIPLNDKTLGGYK